MPIGWNDEEGNTLLVAICWITAMTPRMPVSAAGAEDSAVALCSSAGAACTAFGTDGFAATTTVSFTSDLAVSGAGAAIGAGAGQVALRAVPRSRTVIRREIIGDPRAGPRDINLNPPGLVHGGADAEQHTGGVLEFPVPDIVPSCCGRSEGDGKIHRLTRSNRIRKIHGARPAHPVA